MTASTLKSLRGRIRREIRDEDFTNYVFTDTEINGYIGDAIKAYSKVIPREISGDLALVTNQAKYDAPENIHSFVSLAVGNIEYLVTKLFGGKMTISPVPAASGVAEFEYLGCHAIPDDDSDTSTYDSIDEPLIIKHVKAHCWETLAGDAARYYEYEHGDVHEYQGKTQAQFRTEADKLYGEFGIEVASRKEELENRQPNHVTPTVAAVVGHEKPRRSRTIYKRLH